MLLIAQQLERRRAGLGFTRTEWAAKIGVTYREVWRWETGRCRPVKATLDRIMRTLERLEKRR